MGQNDLAVLTGDRTKEGFLQENDWVFCRGGHKAWFHCTIFHVKPGIIILNFKIYQVINN